MRTATNRRLKTLALGLIPTIALGVAISIDRIPGTDMSLTVPYAAQGPGPTVDTLSAVDGKDVVEIDGARTYPTSGHLNMTTVAVRTNMTLSQAIARWLTTDDTIVPLETVIPTGSTDEEVSQRNHQAFVQSEAAATVSAMNYLNIAVEVVVDSVLDESAAAGEVEPGDVIAAINGTAVSKPGEAQKLVRALAPGDTVTLSLVRGGKDIDKDIVLGQHPEDSALPLLGVTMTSQPADGMDVSYNLQDIGGPSAGMMFSLAVIDKLTADDLTGGHFVAGTGTIGEDGAVGPIGGIKHKVRAARDAGAELFLAPIANCSEAMTGKPGNMQVAAVGTLSDAIAAIDAFRTGTEFPTCTP
ncbi:MAG: PDZ domain-containing protein [Corynebacterium sp.]|nr:PDZ domain-containing protein [Corynebacterium sp.]